MISSFFNLFRLLLLALIGLLLYPIIRKRALYYFLRAAGPSFIKLGQALSVRPDLVGEKTAVVLSRFHDSLPPFSKRKVKAILKREFNGRKLFVGFNYTPIASASVAQVHQATIELVNKKTELVAVKFLRPNIRKIVQRDIRTLKLIAKISALVGAGFAAKFLADIALLLDDTARSELDLTREARNALRLKNNLAHQPQIHIPEVYQGLSTPDVLVLEWISGVPFSNPKKLRSRIKELGLSKVDVARNLVNSYFHQVYVDGFFHADTHPGNLFLTNDGKIALVDFGIMGVIDKTTRLAVAQILIGFLEHDYQKVAEVHVEAGLVPANTDIYELAQDCKQIGELVVGNSVKNISLATLLLKLIEMTSAHKMVVRPELLLLQKTLLLIEGVGMMIDENLNMWVLAQPFVKKWARHHLGFDARIRDYFEGFMKLIKSAKF